MHVHSFLLFLSFLVSVTLFIWGLVVKNKEPYGQALWIAGLVYFFLHPILFELVLNLKALCCKQRLNRHNCRNDFKRNFPIVYSEGYHISFMGLEKLHPFDSHKYRRINNFLREKGVIDETTLIHAPSVPTREFLLQLMTWKYLFKLNYSLYICKCLEVPLFFLPASLLRMNALEPMQRATQGSVDAACMAFIHGWAINLSGGYHHACTTHGGGFCIYPDITFIVHSARMHHGIRRVKIIDLDAHQGNGHERDFIEDKEVHIVDAFNPHIYPGDEYAYKGISTEIPVYR
jgi:histone deacetylase 11